MSFISSGDIAFTVPIVPTGIKAGVLMTPRGVLIMPLRAEPSVFIILKFISPSGKFHRRYYALFKDRRNRACGGKTSLRDKTVL
jgi:hypothetical protein